MDEFKYHRRVLQSTTIENVHPDPPKEVIELQNELELSTKDFQRIIHEMKSKIEKLELVNNQLMSKISVLENEMSVIKDQLHGERIVNEALAQRLSCEIKASVTKCLNETVAMVAKMNLNTKRKLSNAQDSMSQHKRFCCNNVV